MPPAAELAAGAAPRTVHGQGAAALRRGELFPALGLIGLTNGLFGPVSDSIALSGLWAGVLSTFGLSAIIWLAAPYALWGLRSDHRRASRADLLAAAAVAIGFLIPSSHVSWAVLAGLALYLIRTAVDSPTRKAALTLLALTVPLFWSKLMFALADHWILQWDAALVGWVTGFPREGNALDLPGPEWGYLMIAGPCSAFANLALMAPCWAAFQQSAPHGRPRPGWVLAGMAGVIAVNVARIALIGLHPDQYALLHGPVGGGVAGLLTAIVIVIACRLSIKARPYAA